MLDLVRYITAFPKSDIALSYFARLQANNGGRVTNERAYHRLFNRLAYYNLLPTEFYPIDGDNLNGAKVKGIVSSLASHELFQDFGSGVTGVGTVAFTSGDYNKALGLGATNANKIMVVGLDASNFDRRNSTLMVNIVGNARNNSSNIFGSTAWGFQYLNKSANNNQDPIYTVAGSAARNPMNVLCNTKGIHIGVTGGSGTRLFKDGRLQGFNTTQATSGNHASAQIRIYPGGNNATISMGAVWNRALSDAEALTAYSIFADFENERGRFVFNDINQKNVICLGNSETFGFSGAGTQISQPYPYQLTTKQSWTDNENTSLSRNVANRGVNGKTAATLLSELNANSYYGLMTNYHWQNVYVVWIGTNDLGNSGVSATTLKSTIQSICTNLKSVGTNVKVIVVNLLPDATGYTGFSNLSNYNTQAPLFNTALAGDSNFTNGTYSDAIADVSGIPNDGTNRIDGLHLTNTGAGLVADAVIATGLV